MALLNTVAYWLHAFGYAPVFVVLFAESLGIPSPSEIILLLSGYLVWNGEFNYGWVIVTGAAGSTLGAVIAYTLASRGGRHLLEHRLRWLFHGSEGIARWERYFQRHGDITVFTGRLISGVRLFISYPAGLFHMPEQRFILYTAAGALLWPALAAGAGYLLGSHVAAGLAAIHRYEWPVIAGLFALGLAGWLYRRSTRRPNHDDAPESKR